MLRFARVTRIYTASVAHSSTGRQNCEYCNGAKGIGLPYSPARQTLASDFNKRLLRKRGHRDAPPGCTYGRKLVRCSPAQPACQQCLPIGLVSGM
jgi:hypothetical protein